MAYTLTYQMNQMGMQAFCEKYQHREKYLAYCKECPNYQTVWSCPEFSFDVGGFLRPYRIVYVVGAKIDLEQATIEEADTMEKVKEIGWKILLEVKFSMEDRLREMENRAEGSQSLSSGGCNRCPSCSRREGMPCRQPGIMRYSMDAFGFDLTAITKDLFSIDLQWCRGRLPEYFTLIHGLLAISPVDYGLWGEAGFRFART